MIYLSYNFILLFNVEFMGSLAIGIPCLSAPLGTWVAFRIGTRPAVLIGLVIASAGLFLTSVAPTFEVLFFVYGLILPVGHIFVNTPPFFLLDEYFPYDHPRLNSLKKINHCFCLSCGGSLTKCCLHSSVRINKTKLYQRYMKISNKK